MGNWLTELILTNRLKPIADEKTRSAPWEGRTRAQLIYGRTYNDEEPNWNFDGPSAETSESKPENLPTGPTQIQPSPPAPAGLVSAPTPTVAAPVVEKKPLFDKDMAVKYLEDHAATDSTGKCAKYVRKALKHAGFYIPEHPVNAKDYGDYLEWGGLSKVDKVEYTPEKGDIAVIQPHKVGQPGHIQMFTGVRWASDTLQNPKWFYPGKDYRIKVPPYEIYR